MANIGFIGLGLMGSAMVGRLQDKGHNLTVMANRNRAAIDAAVARGATEVSTPRELADTNDIIMLCMDTSANVEARMRGSDGVFAGLRPGAVVIDFGTSLPASTQALAKEATDLGAAYLDGPLGRTPVHAKEGLLNIMCAGEKDAFDKIHTVLNDLGENVFYLGESGAGHTVKLINNFFGMTIANAMSEAFVMADAAGLDRRQMYDVIAAGPLRSGMMDFVSAYGLDGDKTKLEFAIKNAAKDVGYYNQMAKDAGLISHMAPAPLSALENARDAGQGDDMVCQMIDYYAKSLKA